MNVMGILMSLIHPTISLSGFYSQSSSSHGSINGGQPTRRMKASLSSSFFLFLFCPCAFGAMLILELYAMLKENRYRLAQLVRVDVLIAIAVLQSGC